MSKTRCGSLLAILVGIPLVFLAPGSAVAQTSSTSTHAWTPPRTPDGQPNIQGTWGTGPDEVLYTGDLETGEADEVARKIQGRTVARGKSLIIEPPDGLMPYQPWAAAKRQQIPHGRAAESIGRKVAPERPSSLRHLRPQTLCVVGAPRLNFDRDFRVVQTPGYVIMVWEWTHAFRLIPLDGQPHIAPAVKLSMGDSRGRWEGTTLVVETTNLNDWDWLDAAGSFHSDAMSVVERFAFTDANTLSYQVTVQDPKVFTRPWTAAFPLRRTPRQDEEIWEHSCVEGERGVVGILGKDPRK